MKRAVTTAVAVLLASACLSAQQPATGKNLAAKSPRFAMQVGRPIEMAPVTWPEQFDPKASELPAELVWDFFEPKEKRAFTQAERETLAREGFFLEAVPPREWINQDDMVDLYRTHYLFRNDYDKEYSTVPVLVTSDFALHVYHVLFDRMLQDVEKKRFLPALQKLTLAMVKDVQAGLAAAADPNLKQAWTRALAYFSVPAKLLDGAYAVPQPATALAGAELDLISKAGGIALSPLMGETEDYTQYIPRGHYTVSASLKKYFQAMMWYGRRNFSLRSADQTLTALLVCRVLSSPANLALWKKLTEPIQFLVGQSDDLTLQDYAAIAGPVFGANPTPADYAKPAALGEFMKAALAKAKPRITGNKLEDRTDPDSVQKGFRFMGQRFVPDAYIFTRLTSPRVGTDSQPRNMPAALDVMAVLGSARAEELLEKDLGIPKYRDALSSLKAEFQAYGREVWESTVYWAWLDAIRPLLGEKGGEYPYFMRGRKWALKGLSTGGSSWAELKHDTILYSKQSYAEMGDGGDEEIPKQPPMPKAYVEADLAFWNRLVFLIEKTGSVLAEQNLMTDEYAEKLSLFHDRVVKLRSVVAKEVINQPISPTEYETVRKFADDIAPVILPRDAGDIIDNKYKQMALVTDVHTDAFGGRVLQVAVGAPHRIFAAVKDASGGARVCVGYVFTLHEFARPIAQRMTDDEWKKEVYGFMDENGENVQKPKDVAPLMPEWVSALYVK